MKTACFDIGGTAIKYGVLENGELNNIAEIPTNAHQGAEKVIAHIAALVRELDKIDSIGISTAGEVEPSTGTIRLCDNIPGYTGLSPKKILEKELGIFTAVENDVNAAAIGELNFGSAIGKPNFLMLSYGTGVGGAIVQDGQIWRGANFSAGEFGGIITHANEINLCDRGTGSYERYACTTALVNRVRDNWPLIKTGRDVFNNIDNPVVKREIDCWINEIAYGLISLIHTFNPSTIVLGGGIMSEQYILPRLNEILTPLLKPSFVGFELVCAKLRNTAGMMGAGILAQSH